MSLPLSSTWVHILWTPRQHWSMLNAAMVFLIADKYTRTKFFARLPLDIITDFRQNNRSACFSALPCCVLASHMTSTLLSARLHSNLFLCSQAFGVLSVIILRVVLRHMYSSDHFWLKEYNVTSGSKSLTACRITSSTTKTKKVLNIGSWGIRLNSRFAVQETLISCTLSAIVCAFCSKNSNHHQHTIISFVRFRCCERIVQYFLSDR